MITEITSTEIETELNKRNYYKSTVTDTTVPVSELDQPVVEPSLYQNPFFWLFILLGIASLD